MISNNKFPSSPLKMDQTVSTPKKWSFHLSIFGRSRSSRKSKTVVEPVSDSKSSSSRTLIKNKITEDELMFHTPHESQSSSRSTHSNKFSLRFTLFQNLT